jgi:hypothetical protein
MLMTTDDPTNNSVVDFDLNVRSSLERVIRSDHPHHVHVVIDNEYVSSVMQEVVPGPVPPFPAVDLSAPPVYRGARGR